MSPLGSLYSETELRTLLRQDEGQFLEFKSLWDRSGAKARTLDRRSVRDTIAEYIAAFANADGGTLLLGVEDDGSPTGHAYHDEAVVGFFAVPANRLRPSITCATGRITIDGNEVLLIEAPMAKEAVMVEGDGFPYRTGDQVLLEPQEVINARKEAYRRVGYEQRVRPEASIEDLDLELAARFFAKSVLGGRPVEELLVRYGLLQARAGGWGVTNAALLLFGKPPLVRWHPRMGIRFFRVAGTRRRHGKKRNVSQRPRIELPLAEAITEAHRLGQEQIRRSEKLHDLFFKETPEYPEFAWQEAIVNAVAHRDYEIQGQEVEVWFFEDRMEVNSPGELVPPVTLKTLRGHRPVHASRNPLLVRVLADAGLMREEGEGIPRIFDEMEGSFLRPPEIDLKDGVFRLTLFNEPIFFGPSQEWQKLVGDLPIAVAQKKALLVHPSGFTNEDYRKLNRVNRDEAYRQIQELVSLGVLAPPKKLGRGAVYRVAEDLHGARVFLEARLPTLRQFFGGHEQLKNVDYRRLFGLSRYGATRELRRLVGEGFLRIEGQRRGAYYLPLPALGVEDK